jgi:hypothetical protein
VPKVPEVDDGKKVRTGPVDSTLLLPEGTPLHTTKTYDELAEDIAKKRAISHAKKFGAPREPVSGPKIGDSIQAE